MNLRPLLLVIALASYAMNMAAQSFTVYNYSIPEGLPSSEVYEVFQDSHGFLWFATDNGVVKFDGKQMEVLHVKNGLTDPVVFSFFEDSKNRIWFRTFSGKLSYLEEGVIKTYAFNDKLASYTKKGIFYYIITPKDELYFTSRDYFGRIDSTGNLSVKRVIDQGIFYQTVGDESVIGISAHAFPPEQIIVDGKSYPINISQRSYLNRVFRSVKWNNKLYISLNTEVFEIGDGKAKQVVHRDQPVISIGVDKENNFWVGYMSGGAERFSNGDFTRSWKPEFIRQKSVSTVFQDHEGGLWFSTLENGVYHVPNLLIQHFPITSDSRLRGAISFDDRAVVGDQVGRIYEIDAQTKKNRVVRTVNGPILSMYKNRSAIFVSSNSNMYLFDHHLRSEKELEWIANDYFELPTGETYTFGGHRLKLFDKNNNEIWAKAVDLPYRAILFDDSTSFLADRVGLHIGDMELNIRHVVEGLAHVKINNIIKINDTTLMLTTIGKGLVLMHPKTLHYKILNTDNNFLADNIYSSLIDGDVIWLATDKGLLKASIARLTDGTFAPQYLTRQSGLISDKIDFLVEVNNEIWAFSDNMFSVIPKQFSKFSNEHPLFYIDELKVNNKLVKADYLNALHPHENNVAISFGFISFNNPNILLRYRLTANESWVYTANTHLLFSSLAPGRYSFELQYSTSNKIWISAIPDLEISIEQPWWTTWYTLLSGFVILLVLGYLYFRYQQSIFKQKNHYLRIINDHQQKLIQSEIVTLERERNRISKELHDRVGTNLSAIKLTVSQLLQNYREPLAADVEEQFQIALREIKDIIYALTPPSLERYGLFTGLKNYVNKLNKNIPIEISLKTFGKEIHGNELNILLFRVIQELLTNSIKHSFAKNITIHLNSFDDMLNVMYEDDGIGFNYDPLQSGLGLDSIESRINSVNGSLKFESGKFGICYTIDIPITTNKEVA